MGTNRRQAEKKTMGQTERQQWVLEKSSNHAPLQCEGKQIVFKPGSVTAEMWLGHIIISKIVTLHSCGDDDGFFCPPESFFINLAFFVFSCICQTHRTGPPYPDKNVHGSIINPSIPRYLFS